MDTLTVNSLSFAEQFVIWATRISLCQDVSTEQAQDTLEIAFERLRIPEALHSFLDFVGVAAIAWNNADRVPDVHCTQCPSVGEDEWRLLQAVAALQRRDVNLASSWIRDTMPPTCMRMFIDRGLHFAHTLQQRGCVLSIAGTSLSNAPLQRRCNALLH